MREGQPHDIGKVSRFLPESLFSVSDLHDSNNPAKARCYADSPLSPSLMNARFAERNTLLLSRVFVRGVVLTEGWRAKTEKPG